MDLKEQELQGGFRWLMIAGALALIFSFSLFCVDEYVMGGAVKRDKEHAAQMRQLRIAQAGLPARVTDSRQTLPLTIEREEGAATASH